MVIIAQAFASSGTAVLDIADRRQVFIDGRFLAEAYNVALHVHQPAKTGEMNIKPEHLWEVGGVGPYSNVVKEGNTYHMWYHVMASLQWDGDDKSGSICYARSADGIHWEKPNLGVVAYKGSKDNNIIFGHGAAGAMLGQDGGMVFVDPTAPVDQKFRMLIRHPPTGKEACHIFSSPDGIHWQLTHRNAVRAGKRGYGDHLDSQNVMFYDDRLKKYVFYGRKNLEQLGRTIARGESDRVDSFPLVSDMLIVIRPDRFDLSHDGRAMVDYYMSAAVKYAWADDAYYMFPTTYYHYVDGKLQGFKDGLPSNAGPLHSQFAASRDGILWQRYDRRPFVPLGMKGEFDWGNARVVQGMVPSVDGRQIYMYYRGGDWLHGWDRDEKNKRLLTAAGLGADRNIAVLSRVVLRKDGLVSVRAPYGGGEFTTPVLRFQGKELVLNIDTSATGIARVGIIRADTGTIAGYNERGADLPGYTAEDCDLIHTANQINRLVTWSGKSDLSALAGKPVRLRFYLRDCDLYAFQFRR
ncbi:MAG: hypothetical protein ACYTBZ_21520 [Planctomycetota bacterium]|jgi:hypothetical protein